MHTQTIIKLLATLILPVLFIFLVPKTSAAEAAAQFSDNEITIAVENQLLRDSGIDLNEIDVTTLLGIVTLTGQADSLLMKERVAKVTGTIKGVRAVVNQIMVKPVMRTDKAINQDIERTLIQNPVSESWEVTQSVQSGVVTLEGTVDSWAERDIIGRLVKGIRGVVDVDNDIEVVYRIHRPDLEMQYEIEEKLQWDALVNDALIDVSVEGGIAKLSGIVGSVAEQNQAYQNAWVAGIDKVDISDLDVNWWVRNSSQREQKYPEMTEEKIKTAVQDALLFDPRVRKFTVEVMVDRDQVTLKGVVDNLRAKRSAIQDARNTLGVWRVRDLIKVRPAIVTDDETLAETVKNVLLADPVVGPFPLEVSVIDNNVYLDGTVDNLYQKARADYVVSGITGVKTVRNRIETTFPDTLAHSPYVDPWDTYNYSWYHYPGYSPIQSDMQIMLEIEDKLRWSPQVDSDTIEVTVDKGVATLTGTVDSWSGYRAAAQKALEGGAVAIDNELQVIEAGSS